MTEPSVASREAEFAAWNSYRTARGKRWLCDDDLRSRGHWARIYQDTTDPDERVQAQNAIRRIDGEPELGSFSGLGIPEGIREITL